MNKEFDPEPSFWRLIVSAAHGTLGVSYVVAACSVLVAFVVWFVSFLRAKDLLSLESGSFLMNSIDGIYSHRYYIVALCVVTMTFVLKRYIEGLMQKKEAIGPKSRDFYLNFTEEFCKLNSLIVQSHGGVGSQIGSRIEPLDKSDVEHYLSILIVFERCVGGSLHCINNVLSTYTGRRCHVSLKLFDCNTGMVRRYRRDKLDPRREKAEQKLEKFPYEDDTAFSEIISRPECGFYVMNSMKKKFMAKSFEYRNVQEDWHDYFDSVLCVPVTLKRASEAINDQGSVVGFLCVDNMGGGFDKTCVSLLMSYAHCLYALLNVMDSVNPQWILMDGSSSSVFVARNGEKE